MSSPGPNYDLMAAELAEVFRKCNWEMRELQEYFPLSEKKTGELSQEDYLRAWMLDQRGSAESLVHALSKWLSLRDIRYLLGLAGKVSLLPNANDKTVLYEWLHHHGFELSKIYDSAWCIGSLRKMSIELRRLGEKAVDLDAYVARTRKYLERCLKTFLCYTWGLLAYESPESYKYLEKEAKEKTDHSRFLHKFRSPDDLISLLIIEKRPGSNQDFILVMQRLIVTLEWTKKAVDLFGKKVINDYISDSWAISNSLVDSLEKGLIPLLNKDLHDRNAGKGTPLDPLEFAWQLEAVCRLLCDLETESMLPRVVQQKSLLTKECGIVARVVNMSKSVTNTAGPIGGQTIDLVYKEKSPPEDLKSPTFLYSKQHEGRVEDFCTCSIPEGALDLGRLHDSDDDKD